ncbi:MAG TPA: HisA/HisF-related TIM barrel protein [Acidimicrobiales bacterium]|jgi:phosphoribosylformimino-5-aminoimidazole carboxamide ribotide isomerase|nr:HisA/HisF-related TIM barrel protein [Acidimicrobiales bacterium]
MDLYAAIDLRGGRSVRLVQGDYERERTFGDPQATAEELVAAGARHLHVVDLDAARTGEPVHRPVVGRIATVAREAGVFLQAGGGIRDEAGAAGLLEAGVARVVLGTAALEQPGLIRRLAKRYPGMVAVGLDHRRVGAAVSDRPVEAGDPAGSLANARVALRGWTQSSGDSLLDVLARFEDAGVAAVVVTDIGRDGTLQGPDLEGLSAVLGATALPVIASGGVASLDHLVGLAGLARAGRGLAGVIVGTALREGRFGVREGLAACTASG